jgi:hypothetical protein
MNMSPGTFLLDVRALAGGTADDYFKHIKTAIEDDVWL